jgi:hypothetical protein
MTGALAPWWDTTQYMAPETVGRMVLMIGYRAGSRATGPGVHTINPAATAMLPWFRGWDAR